MKTILSSNSSFIILIISYINLTPVKMNQEEILLTEMLKEVGDSISEETVAEKVKQFIKYGNVFLFFEMMSLRKEIERIKEEIPDAMLMRVRMSENL